MGGNRMKKNLIVALALVFVLGIAGTAFAAANPFVDVPAKHWAYDAVTKLAQAGILDGYGDGTYRGERLATRYEMAQATAKAMARADKADAQMKGLIDKLAVEFAAELNNLGVRVAKLEKNASTIKFWGDARMRYQSGNNGALDNGLNSTRFQQRIRVYAKADLNDKAAFYGRLASEWTSSTNTQTTQNADIFWDYGYFQWNFNPNFSASFGRHFLAAGYNTFWTNGGYDGAQFYYKNGKFDGKFAYGDVGNYVNSGKDTKSGTAQEVLLLDLTYAFSNKFSMNGVIYNAANDKLYPYRIWALGFKTKLNDDFSFQGQYFSNSANLAKAANAGKTPDGWLADLWYKGADKAKVGSWGLNLNYRNIKPSAIDGGKVSGVFANSMTSNWDTKGVKGWGFQANYTVSKNAILTATYETLNRNASGDTGKLKPFYYLQMNVYF
jgi:hypothetical protein